MLSSTHYVAKLDDDYDVVFIYQLSPVMMANAGIQYKKKFNKKMMLYCLDLWPESLVAGGIKRGSLFYRFFHWVSKKIYVQADKILISSKSFSEYFESEFGIENTEYLPQYSESFFTPEQCAKYPSNTIDLMFAGNIGAAQSVETIIEAANLTKNIDNLRWHIVGDGSELEKAKKMSTYYGLSSIFFHGRQPVEKMPEYYAMADAMLITMKKDPVLSMTLPGKVQTYMAAGKPIIGAIDGETKSIICLAKCGLCTEAEDAEKLAESVRTFSSNPPDWSVYSNNSINFYQNEFSKYKFMNILEKQLRM